MRVLIISLCAACIYLNPGEDVSIAVLAIIASVVSLVKDAILLERRLLNASGKKKTD